MTSLNNIQMQMAASASKAPTNSIMGGQASNAGFNDKDKAQGLESFIGALLSQVNSQLNAKASAEPSSGKPVAPTAASSTADTSKSSTADADNLAIQAALKSGDTKKLQELVEKIADKLGLDPADPATAGKIIEAMQNGTVQADPQLVSLTSDLSAQMALILNDDTKTGMLDEKLLASLKDALDTFMAKGDVSEEDLKAFTKDLVQQLQAQGLDDKTIAQYVQALKLPNDEPVASSLIPPQVEEALKGSSTSPAPAAPEVAPQFSDAKTAVGTNALPKQPEKAAGAGSDIQQPQQQAEVKPEKTHERPANIAMVNEIAANNADAATATDSTALNKAPDSLQSIMGLKSGDTTNTQGFVNYMQGTGRNISAPTMQMIALQIQQNANNKVSSFTMQLEPADLGRLDIEMSFDKSGSMKAHVSADKPETLAMLQRDSQHLNRVLQQAGIDVDENSLSFDLRDNSDQSFARAYDDEGRGQKSYGRNNALAGDNIMNAQIAVQSMGYITQSGVNIMV